MSHALAPGFLWLPFLYGGTGAATQTISPGAVASAEQFGTPIVAGPITPTGIVSEEDFASVLFIYDAAFTGIMPASIQSAESVPAPTLGGPISPTGIASEETWGDVSIPPLDWATQFLTTTAISTAEAWGDPTVAIGLQNQGIVSGEVVPSPVVGAGTNVIAPLGIGTAEAFGELTLYNHGTAIGQFEGSGGILALRRLCSPLNLIAASSYVDPDSGADLLPDVYGDFSDLSGLRGPIPAVLIDKTSFTYAAAGHPVHSITNIYVDDIEVTSGFTVNNGIDYQGVGQIATITFDALPEGTVTWRGKVVSNSTIA